MSDLTDIVSLENLFEYIEKFNAIHYPNSTLKPIYGGGEVSSPKYMFVFINPTKKNIASDPSWTGQRVPWIGLKPIYKVFHSAGIISDSLLEIILNKKPQEWSPEFVDRVYAEFKEKSIYITNIVKWAGEDATLPEKEKIERYFPILKKEIDLIKPENIVAFGRIPFEKLSKSKKIFKTYYDELNLIGKMSFEMYQTSRVYPCYFPVGMGRFKQKEAIEILNSIL